MCVLPLQNCVEEETTVAMSEDKKSKDLQNKEDPAQLSKRKKLLDNMKGSTQKQPKSKLVPLNN